MNKITALFLALCIWLFFPGAFQPLISKTLEQPIVVIIPSYNNLLWYKKNISSILKQKYKNYRIIYINDCSTDGTGAAVRKYIREKKLDYSIIEFDNKFGDDIEEATQYLMSRINKKKQHFFTFINNKTKCGALANLYRAIHSCSDREIIVTVDGDDFLSHENVLKELDIVYSSGDIWLTHGCMIEWPSNTVGWSIPIPEEIIKNNAFREYRCPSHLRTFRCWLFKQIKLEDLLLDGKFFPMTWDMAMMFPMCEMAGERHAFISNVNYCYNMSNPINDNKVDALLQRNLDFLIRNKPKYPRLERAPI